jgi:asparagine synthase (glutamine-hydrolysing)
MCGVVAIFAYGAAAAPVDPGEVKLVRDAMTHRGPDAAGSWLAEHGRAGFGHRRLSIIDTSDAGNQPMSLPERGVVITFNGEIYNYRELRERLQQGGRRLRTQSDTEVLLHLYDLHGARMVEHLRGMFAFALWDERKQGLLLARDPFGIKPLYYADDGAALRVASQVKALLASERIDGRPSAAGQVSFLVWGFVAEPHTLYRGITALPAGTTLWIDRNGPRRPERYWDVAAVLAAAERGDGRHISTQEAQHEALRQALSDSVRYHLVADVPVGIFLSGGLDSGVVASFAASQSPRSLHTLTLGFDELLGTPADEVSLAAQTAAIYGTRHATSWIGSDRFARERSRLLAAMDQPTIDGVNVYFISQMAAAAGLKVALSGLGGDELFGGYPSFRQIPRMVRQLRFLAASPTLGRAVRAAAGPLMRRFTSPKYASLLEYGTSVEDAYLLRRGLFMPWELPNVLAPEPAREGWEELAPRAHLRQCTGEILGDRAKVMALEMSMYMRNQLLRDSDWAGMAHSLEIRVPFVDHRLFAELAPMLVGAAAPSKADMVKVLRRPLPADVLSRPKTGFAVPIREWLLKGDDVQATDVGRGLRGWARYILRHQLAASVQRPEALTGGVG